jgi:hypothetical protein
MHHVRQEDLPHAGSSHQFIGAEQGDVGCSVGEIHGFTAIGDANLVQVDVHMSPTFIQENL